MPRTMITALHERGWRFYTFIGEGGVRLMCSWDTTEQDIDDFIGDIRSIARTGRH
jgi:threonine aldolase